MAVQAEEYKFKLFESIRQLALFRRDIVNQRKTEIKYEIQLHELRKCTHTYIYHIIRSAFNDKA